MRGSLPVAVRSNMSGFVWFLAKKKKAWLSLSSADTDHSVAACQRWCFISCIFILGLSMCVCVCVFRDINVYMKCLICKCNANAPYQSALSHLEEGVEIIHESCHLSQSLSNLSVELWRKTSDSCWETQRDPSSSLFFSSFHLAEDSVSCENPGLPDNGYQILSKRLYLPGESLTFVCYQGYELIGEVAIKCILGNPSFWSGPLPLCRGETFADFFIFMCVEWNFPSFSIPLDVCMCTIFFKDLQYFLHACWYRLIMPLCMLRTVR